MKMKGSDSGFAGLPKQTAAAGDGISSMPAGPLSMPPPFVEGRRRSVEGKKTRPGQYPTVLITG